LTQDVAVTIAQVVPADASAHSDQKRLLLSVNHNGTILRVNPGEPPASVDCQIQPAGSVSHKTGVALHSSSLLRNQLHPSPAVVCHLVAPAYVM
jgi:hypothetical protein